MRVSIALDVGGTFTDLALVEETTGRMVFGKVPSTPDDPSRAILEGTAALLSEIGADGASVGFFGHGTTVVTNMIVERKGARLALVTTEGFRDVLDLARQARPAVYDYRVTRPPPLAERRNRFELRERMAPDGSVLIPLDPADLDRLAGLLHAGGYDAVAICCLHAYANPAHEAQIRDVLAARLPGVFITTSHEVAPEYREFERFSTTALNGYVGPRTTGYFRKVEAGLTEMGLTCPLFTITSNAGLVDVDTAVAQPVRTALSGPAAGVAGIGRLLASHALGDLITFDVGGTSTDVAVVSNGRPRLARARSVAGYPVLAPMVDIEVIGAGGGSLARIDAAGALTVGPDSAGARPGPVAYGQGGTIPTVTDAALTLGRLDPDIRLAGRYGVDAGAARAAIAEAIGAPLGLDADEAAEGILGVAAANMARIIRSVALSRGYEPERMTLVAFGGAGPLLAADVAQVLGISRIAIPASPGTLCARAVLVSDIARDLSVTRVLPLSPEGMADIESTFAEMEHTGADWLSGAGIAPADHRFERRLEARYAGQNFEIGIEAEAGADAATLRGRFDETHAAEQGYSLSDRAVEAVTLRLKAHARPAHAVLPVPSTAQPGASHPEPSGSRLVHLDGAAQRTSIFHRDALSPGARIAGPAIVEETTSTTVIPPGWGAEVLWDRTLLMRSETGEQP